MEERYFQRRADEDQTTLRYLEVSSHSRDWILQVPNRGVSLARELRGALFVPYLTNPETTEHRPTLYCQGPRRVPLRPGGQSLLDTCQD
ncbi:hypothetical protein EV2_018600 [Malus domestica]